LILILAIFLVACGSQEATQVVSEATLSDLQAEVNVHDVANLKDHEDVFLLDVREQWEYDEGHIPGVTLLPLGDIPNRLDELPTDKTVIVTCRSGNRSGQAASFLRQNGFDNVHNMSGGILEWQEAGYEIVR
jgi:rhodanese-related sulfurtransferase